jgi:hypothetical protein
MQYLGNFEVIWRLALFYKLLKHNIPHRIFNIIHSMYIDTICRIKFSNGLSASFSSAFVTNISILLKVVAKYRQ